mgnify:CR=1 FL=1
MRQRTAQEEFWKFTDEEMETAKNTDLPDLLEHLGYHLKRMGSYYAIREMDSLMIKNRRTWKRYSSGKGGDAITFLQEFENMGFRETVIICWTSMAGPPPPYPGPGHPLPKNSAPSSSCLQPTRTTAVCSITCASGAAPPR